MSESSVPPEPPKPPADPSAEPRQRWRLVVARDPDAPSQSQRDLAERWTTAIEGSGLPLARTEGARRRPRIWFGAPLPLGMAAGGELIDIVLTERWPAWRVREAVAGRLPAGWRLVELQDVWLAGPSLAGQVAAADYRITLGLGADAAALARAARELLAASRIERYRTKGSTSVTYDLRPLLIDVHVSDPGPPPVIATRTRIHPELGTGRPEEVVAALGDRLAIALESVSVSRECLVLIDDLD